jgi:hypothetical protein
LSVNPHDYLDEEVCKEWITRLGGVSLATSRCYDVMATNRDESADEVTWKQNGLRRSENCHKELITAVGMGQMPCAQFEANAVHFAI